MIVKTKYPDEFWSKLKVDCDIDQITEDQFLREMYKFFKSDMSFEEWVRMLGE